MLQEREEVHLATIQRLSQRLALEINSNQRLSSLPTEYLASDEFAPRAFHDLSTSVLNPGKCVIGNAGLREHEQARSYTIPLVL